MCGRISIGGSETRPASINILRMKNDAETILKSWVALVTSLYCSWNDFTNVCRAWNPQHTTERSCCVYVAKLLQTHYKVFFITCVLYCEMLHPHGKTDTRKSRNVVTILMFFKIFVNWLPHPNNWSEVVMKFRHTWMIKCLDKMPLDTQWNCINSLDYAAYTRLKISKHHMLYTVLIELLVPIIKKFWVTLPMFWRDSFCVHDT